MASNLPVEIVTHIMRFLSVSDRKEASLVNKTWYEASLDPILEQDLIITFSSTIKCSNTAINFGRRRTPNLIFNQIDSFSQSKDVVMKSCQHLGQSLQTLSFKGSNITESMFFSFLIHCNNLTKLDLSCCNSLFMSGKLLEKSRDQDKLRSVLKNVKELDISSIRFMSDMTFNRLAGIFINLEKLSLASCQILFQATNYLSRRNGTYSPGESMNVLTFSNLINYLKLQKSKMISLNMGRTAINDEALDELVSIEGLQLKELCLTGCKEVTDSALVTAFKKQTGLEIIDVGACPELGDGTVMAIQNHLHHVKKINLRQCRFVSDKSVAEIHNLGYLSYLDLSASHRVSSKGLEMGLCSPHLESLTSLFLNGCGAVNDRFVMLLCDMLKNLEVLDLRSCFEVGDFSLHAIVKNLKYLRSLNLGWCKKITDLGLLGLVSNEPPDHKHDGMCKCMRNMDPSQVYKFTDPTKLQYSPPLLNPDEIYDLQRKQKSVGQVRCLTHLSHLQFLSFEAVPHITDVSVAQVMKFRELKHLNLTMCSKLTDVSLAAFAKHIPSLEELSIGQCSLITDSGLQLVLSHVPRLTSLSLANCDRITDNSIRKIGEKCKQLRRLDVSFCSQVSESAMDRLEEKLCHLTDVQRRYIKATESTF